VREAEGEEGGGDVPQALRSFLYLTRQEDAGSCHDLRREGGREGGREGRKANKSLILSP